MSVWRIIRKPTSHILQWEFSCHVMWILMAVIVILLLSCNRLWYRRKTWNSGFSRKSAANNTKWTLNAAPKKKPLTDSSIGQTIHSQTSYWWRCTNTTVKHRESMPFWNRIHDSKFDWSISVWFSNFKTIWHIPITCFFFRTPKMIIQTICTQRPEHIPANHNKCQHDHTVTPVQKRWTKPNALPWRGSKTPDRLDKAWYLCYKNIAFTTGMHAYRTSESRANEFRHS